MEKVLRIALRHMSYFASGQTARMLSVALNGVSKGSCLKCGGKIVRYDEHDYVFGGSSECDCRKGKIAYSDVPQQM